MKTVASRHWQPTLMPVLMLLLPRCMAQKDPSLYTFRSGMFSKSFFFHDGHLHSNYQCKCNSMKRKMRWVTNHRCATKITTPEGDFEFDVPKAKLDFNYDNSAYLACQAHHVRECLAKGLLESPVLPTDETIVLAEILETIRKQVGNFLPQDRI